MSRKTVRTAVASYFAPSAVTGLNRVTRAKLRNLAEEAPDTYFPDATTQTGAAGWLYLANDHEKRISAPTVLGNKLVTYDVGLRIDFRSRLDDAEASIDAYDDMIEAIKAHLRADPTLGTGPGGIVFQAGEGDAFGSQDIEVISDEPRETGKGTTTIQSIVRFLVVEFIQA